MYKFANHIVHYLPYIQGMKVLSWYIDGLTIATHSFDRHKRPVYGLYYVGEAGDGVKYCCYIFLWDIIDDGNVMFCKCSQSAWHTFGIRTETDDFETQCMSPTFGKIQLLRCNTKYIAPEKEPWDTLLEIPFTCVMHVWSL